jgi:hypothetical protein
MLLAVLKMLALAIAFIAAFSTPKQHAHSSRSLRPAKLLTVVGLIVAITGPAAG